MRQPNQNPAFFFTGVDFICCVNCQLVIKSCPCLFECHPMLPQVPGGLRIVPFEAVILQAIPLPLVARATRPWFVFTT